MDCNNFLDDSLSDNSVSDTESFECNEMETENEREMGEDAGLEGMRCLLGAQVRDLDNMGEPSNLMGSNEMQETSFLGEQIIKENGHTLTVGHWSARKEGLEQAGQVIISDESRPEVRIGKIGVPWKQINEAVGALNLELLENEMDSNNRSVQPKPCKSLIRRKRGERELYNLKCSIDYDKGKQVQGIENDT